MLRAQESAYAKAWGRENNFKELKAALEVQTDGERKDVGGKSKAVPPFQLSPWGNTVSPIHN